MKARSVLYWLSQRSTLVVTALLIALGVLVAYFLTVGFSSSQAQAVIGIASVSAFLAAISATANLLQAVEVQRQRELMQRPYVTASFEGSSKGLIYLLIQNSGNSPARDVRLAFDPAPRDFSGRPLDQVSVFSRPITFLPPASSVRQLIDAGNKLLADGQPTRFRVTISYQSIEGRQYSERVDHDIEWMKQATVPEKSAQDYLEEISKYLKKMAG
jgi:uncharacterized protein (UPF0333 family)